ncbi:MAG: hypothetical protein CL858_12660 [Cupriavidus sp.]|uniref:hypothetical protein n=1 Tax=Cupriavidus TaxID=106589 RepID=UPI0004BA5581|nr:MULTISPECIES: hypothetical protein [Cupriavidus]MBU66292.1 hypothetical protein [Cupriavidus sp.]MCA3185623.1 hypothetical protein [Cupriavidus sp.]MCA3193914.1 hypothetical protein [Cupriavidus sp.]MCA3198343.1 hypothetical protein [Cupriavidus sp.]MCA3233850.1 hypothetical protein [Cupriavidus sp.]
MFPKTIDIEVGPVPAEESCAQVGRDDYEERSRRECAVYIRQLQRIFQHPNPAVLKFVRRGFPHELGRYHEVVAVMTAEGADLFDETKLPLAWDHVARAELTWLRLQYQWRETVLARPTALALVPDIFHQRDIPDFPDHPAAMWWAMGFMPMPAGRAIAVH